MVISECIKHISSLPETLGNRRKVFSFTFCFVLFSACFSEVFGLQTAMGEKTRREKKKKEPMDLLRLDILYAFVLIHFLGIVCCWLTHTIGWSGIEIDCSPFSSHFILMWWLFLFVNNLCNWVQRLGRGGWKETERERELEKENDKDLNQTLFRSKLNLINATEAAQHTRHTQLKTFTISE